MSSPTQPEVFIYRMPGPSMTQESQVQQMDHELRGLAHGVHRARVAIDFGEVHYITSRVLGILVAFHKDVDKAGGHIVLFGLNPATQRVLKVTRLDSILREVASEDEARQVLLEGPQ